MESFRGTRYVSKKKMNKLRENSEDLDRMSVLYTLLEAINKNNSEKRYEIQFGLFFKKKDRRNGNIWYRPRPRHIDPERRPYAYHMKTAISTKGNGVIERLDLVDGPYDFPFEVEKLYPRGNKEIIAIENLRQKIGRNGKKFVEYFTD